VSHPDQGPSSCSLDRFPRDGARWPLSRRWWSRRPPGCGCIWLLAPQRQRYDVVLFLEPITTSAKAAAVEVRRTGMRRPPPWRRPRAQHASTVDRAASQVNTGREAAGSPSPRRSTRPMIHSSAPQRQVEGLRIHLPLERLHPSSRQQTPPLRLRATRSGHSSIPSREPPPTSGERHPARDRRTSGSSSDQ
jgi:hypothetical protein